MALQVRNIIVGAAQLYLGRNEQVQPLLPAFVAATPFATTMDATVVDWRAVGLTTAGLDVAYNPTYTDVTVDQLKDAALLFGNALTVTVTTTMVESTLQNLVYAWGQHDASLSTGANPDTSGNTDVLGVAGGALGDYPVERSLVAIGNSPRTATTTTKRERVYHARRVISVTSTTHGLHRDAATVFPVSFRLLPDPTYSGSEYGKVIDRTL